MKWPIATLATALRNSNLFNDGDWIESKDQDPHGDVRLIQLADIGDGEYVDKSARFLTSQKAQELKCSFLKSGDVLVARMPDPLGRACIFPGDSKPSVTVVDVCIVRPNQDGPDARWLMHCLNSTEIRNQIAAFATGTTRSRISRSNLAKIKIPLPPLTEQRRIAEILDKADALRAKRRAALAQLDILSQSIFLDMFGDSETIFDRWPKSTLGSLLAFLTSGSRGWAQYYSVDGDLFLRIQNVGRDELLLGETVRVRAPNTAEARRTRVQAGDVLLSITADLGRTAVVPKGFGPAFINQHLAILRVHSVEPRFLSAYLASPTSQRQILGLNRHGVKAGLNFDDIRSLLVPIPPTGLQRIFQDRIARLEQLRKSQLASAAHLDRFFASIQRRAFRGEL